MLEPSYPLRTERLDLRPYRPGDLDDLRDALRQEGDGLSPLAVLRETGEVGFVPKLAFQGPGLATEMAREMPRVGFEEMRCHRIIGRCDARNTASAAGKERLGVRRDAQLRQNEWVKGEWTGELSYAMLADEWAALRAGRG